MGAGLMGLGGQCLLLGWVGCDSGEELEDGMGVAGAAVHDAFAGDEFFAGGAGEEDDDFSADVFDGAVAGASGVEAGVLAAAVDADKQEAAIEEGWNGFCE
jgi:hypothetical protein